MRYVWDWLLAGLVTVVVIGCVFVAGNGSPERREVSRLRVQAEALTQTAAEQHDRIKELQARVDYLEKRETAQTLLNKTFIDFARSVRPKAHVVDGPEFKGVEPQNLPTVPKD